MTGGGAKNREFKVRKDGVGQHYHTGRGSGTGSGAGSGGEGRRRRDAARSGVRSLAADARGGGAERGLDADGREVWFLSSPSGGAFTAFVEDVKALPREKRFFNAKLKKWVVEAGADADELMRRYGFVERTGNTGGAGSAAGSGAGSVGGGVSAGSFVDSDGTAILRVSIPTDVYFSGGVREKLAAADLVGRKWDDDVKQWVFLDTPKSREFLSGLGVEPVSDGGVAEADVVTARDVAVRREALLEARRSARQRGAGFTRRRTSSGNYVWYDDNSDDEYDAWKDGELDSLPGVSDARYESYRRGLADPGRWR